MMTAAYARAKCPDDLATAAHDARALLSRTPDTVTMMPDERAALICVLDAIERKDRDNSAKPEPAKQDGKVQPSKKAGER